MAAELGPWRKLVSGGRYLSSKFPKAWIDFYPENMIYAENRPYLLRMNDGNVSPPNALAGQHFR